MSHPIIVGTHSANQPILAENDLIASAEQQESPSTIGVLGLSGPQALVSYQGTLLVPNNSRNKNTCQRLA